jgi:hypothetical protein
LQDCQKADGKADTDSQESEADMEPENFICDACGLPPHSPGAQRLMETGLPSGWVRRTFGRRTFTLCDCCGSIHHFKDGVSAYLQETLGLAPNATCDFSGSTELGSGLHRLRVKSPGSSNDPDLGGGA